MRVHTESIPSHPYSSSYFTLVVRIYGHYLTYVEVFAYHLQLLPNYCNLPFPTETIENYFRLLHIDFCIHRSAFPTLVTNRTQQLVT